MQLDRKTIQQIKSAAGKLPECNTHALVRILVKGQDLLNGTAKYNIKVMAQDGNFTINSQTIDLTEAEKQTITPLADYEIHSFELVNINHYNEMIAIAQLHPNNWQAECKKYAETIINA